MNRIIIILIIAAVGLLSQDQPPVPGDRARRIRNTEFFRAQREAEAARPAAPKATSSRKPAAEMLGVTLWRLRASRSGDQARVLIHEPDGEAPQQLTPERISLDTRLLANDRVRISIESARHGFLYVASRERFADGSMGPASLIFPSRRIAGGNNHVQPGQLVDIPEPTNRRPYLTVKKSRPDHLGESLLIVVTKAPIEGLIVENGQRFLSEQQIAAWQKEMSTSREILEVPETVGRPWTSPEQSAAQGAVRLKMADPAPQTIYRFSPNDKQSLVVDLLLKVAE